MELQNMGEAEEVGPSADPLCRYSCGHQRKIKAIHTKNERNLTGDLQVYVGAHDEESKEIRKKGTIAVICPELVPCVGVSSGNEIPRSSAERGFDPPKSVLRHSGIPGMPVKMFVLFHNRRTNVKGGNKEMEKAGPKNQIGVSWGRHPGLLIDPKRGERQQDSTLAHIERKKKPVNLYVRGGGRDRTTFLVPLPMMVSSCFYWVIRSREIDRFSITPVVQRLLGI